MSRYSWVESAWSDLTTYARRKGIDITGAVDRDINTAMSRGHTMSFIAESYELLMVFLSGYYLIAADMASNQVVNDVFDTAWEEISSVAQFEATRSGFISIEALIAKEREKTGIRGYTEEGYLGAVLRIKKLRDVFSNAQGGSRFDKVNAIETFIHMVHEEGLEFMIFVGQSLRSGELEGYTVPRLLDVLANQE